MQEIGANSLHTPYIYNRIQRSTHTNGGRAKILNQSFEKEF